MDTSTPNVNFPVIPDSEFAERMSTFKKEMAQQHIDLVVVFSNLLVDISYGYLDPRVRVG